VPLWNSIISAYVAHGQYTESFQLLSSIISVEQLVPATATYMVVIGACAAIREIETGRLLHARMINERMLLDVRMLNSLVTLYSNCGALREAMRVFDVTDGMNVVSWNAIIAGYYQNRECERALSLFSRLNREQVVVKPNSITYLSVLSAVSFVLDLRLGEEVPCSAH